MRVLWGKSAGNAGALARLGHVDDAGGDLNGAGREPEREPAVRAPWPVAALSLGLLIAYGLQTATGQPQDVASRLGFSPVDLEVRRWGGLFTALFVHGNWAHVVLNSLGALAFGAPIVRVLGRGGGAAAGFFLLFLVSGVAASLGFGALHPGEAVILIGASGGVSGLMGGASRLIERRGVLAPFTSRIVLGMAGAWVLVNLLVGFAGLQVAGEAPIAWEAHLVGYAAGLALVGPFVWVSRLARSRREDAPD
jgi:membrane associated rhomboid family serine protease